MNTKLKAALISLAIITFLTLAKFIAYFFSGSLAVYSEAWHSFSDIATTLLVVISIWMSVRRKERDEHRVKRSWADPERVIAIAISLWLFVIAITILIQGVTGQSEPVTNPLITGLVFIVLSLGSFFIYRYQAITAEAEASSALKADSQHNRTDMVISLLTGFSLVLYSIGFDIDQYVAILIGILILLIAIEMAVNAVITISRKDSERVSEYHITQIFLAVFDSQFANTVGNWFCDTLNINGDRRDDITCLLNNGRKLSRLVFGISVIIAVLFWLSTSFFQVPLDQHAVLTRFGQKAGAGEALSPGLYMKWPWPVDRVTYIDTGTVYSVSIGDSAGSREALIWGRSHEKRLEFMSADNNFFLPYISLHFKIEDPQSYYLNGSDPESLARRICMQELTSEFVRRSFYELALYGRQAWVNDVALRIQSQFDALNSGLSVVSLDLKDFHPPAEVAKSFESIVAATQERETMLNEAQVKKNVMIPEARLNALEKISQAQSTAVSKVSKAQGEAERYEQQLASYQVAPEIIMSHLNLNNQKRVLSGRNKIIYDPKAGVSAKQLYQEQFIFGGRFRQELNADKSAPVRQEMPEIERDQPQRIIRRAPIRD